MESEEESINFVKRVAPQVSTPNAIRGWTGGNSVDRSVLIMRLSRGLH